MRSNPLTVFVDKSLPQVAQEEPQTKVKSPGDAVWIPGGDSVGRTDADGRLIWKTHFQEAITALEGANATWIATSETGRRYGIDVATGKLLWIE